MCQIVIIVIIVIGEADLVLHGGDIIYHKWRIEKYWVWKMYKDRDGHRVRKGCVVVGQVSYPGDVIGVK